MQTIPIKHVGNDPLVDAFQRRYYYICDCQLQMCVISAVITVCRMVINLSQINPVFSP